MVCAECKKFFFKEQKHEHYGIYNTMKKEFQFGIVESSKEEAIQKLFNKIGKDAYKWRFKARRMEHV